MHTTQRHWRFILPLLLIAALLIPAAPAALAQDAATISYFRPDGDYEGWALHVWGDASQPTTWDAPLAPAGADDFGIFWEVPLKSDASELNFIIHRGDEKDPGSDMTLDLTKSNAAWIVSGVNQVYLEAIDPNEVATSDVETTEPAPPSQTAPTSVSFPGNYAPALGGSEWAPADATVQGSDEDGDGVWTLVVNLPAGSYEFKVAINGAWDENYGLNGEASGVNIPLTVPDGGATVTLSYERATNAIETQVTPLPPVQEAKPALGDGRFSHKAILHDSRSDLYRTPLGAQPLQSDVTLRLRTAANDVTGVNLLATDLATGSSLTRAMRKAASDSQFDWWEITINTGSQVTVHKYMFQLEDGAGALIYADDNGRDGGVGAPSISGAIPDQGWDIYTYEPGFDAPEWAKNAVIYQIFPDRFRNGDPSNDPTAQDWFYPDERGHVFPVTPWNTLVPDPIPMDSVANPDWYSTFSSTFYGGDLQGVMQKLDYLQSLGVTTIYFNPIFESPSNHKYDGRDYHQVDDNLAVLGDPAASMAYFDDFAAEVASRGMHLILDGVPNHTSSDSPDFDRFGRYDTVGACESEESPYRSWYFFDPARPAGSGVCAGDANYRGWAGVSTLPQANTANQAVIDNWLGQDGVINQWLSKPGVDGWRIDVVPDVVGVNPRFFEQFRDAAKATNPNALLISETWAERDARMRLLGDEFDSSMNYRFRLAVLGFLRDDDFSDGDGGVAALNASEFDAALRAIQEDYPPAAFASAMNLLSSHDVNRAVRVLDHDGVDYDKLQPKNDFLDGRSRLALAAVLQMTLPGAPTIYYGDEVGLVGFGVDIQRDDPYNRQPYPWPDAEGYDSLPSWRQQDSALLAHYQQLGQLRGAHSYLRTGSWQTLQINDDGLYVYGRKDESGAALIAVNRSATTQTVTLNVAGYLPVNATLNDPLRAATLAVGSSGALSYTVPGMGYQLWLTGEDVSLTAPNPPTLTLGLEGDGSVTLNLSGNASDAAEFAVYRSLVDGGYEEIGRVAAGETVDFTDDSLSNGVTYYYRAAAIAADQLSSALTPAVSAVPHATITSVTVLDPLAIEHTLSAITPTMASQAAVLIPGVSELSGAPTGVLVQVGFAAADAAAKGAAFTWADATYVTDNQGGADVFAAAMLPRAAGDYVVAWRASTSGGRDWVTSANQAALKVYAAADTEAPKAPFRIDELARSDGSVAFAWRVSRPPDLYGYTICRADLTAQEAGCATTFEAPKASSLFTDTTVMSGHAYSYTVQVVDNAFNMSPPSASIVLTAEQSLVEVTWRVLAPAETPAEDLLFIAGDNGDVFGSAFNPGLQAMTPAGDNIWEWSASVKEGTVLQYKYTRGAWESVEQWGKIAGFANRQLTVVNQGEGKMMVDDTATDWGAGGADDHRAIQTWRDPLVKVVQPAPGSSGAAPDAVRVEMSVPVATLDLAQVITVQASSGAPVVGAVQQSDDGRSFAFTPSAAWAAGVYTATVSGVSSDTPMAVPYRWSFTLQ